VTDRQEALIAVANFLMQRIRLDKYPSVTHMQLLESMIPRPLVREYLNILLEKVLEDSQPSIPMLRRLVRVAESV
jgi:hypothetical protein